MRVLVIVNSRAGGGDAGIYDFIRIVGLEGAEVVLRYITEDRRVEDLLTDVATFDRVVAAGGDGTVSSVCYATRSTGVPVLVYPSGTANLLALNLGLPLEAPALSEVLLRGVPVGFDLGELEHQQTGTDETVKSGFAIMAGCGYDAVIMHNAEQLKSTLGPVAYFVAAASNLSPTSARFELVLDGERVSTDGIAVVLANFARIQFDLPITPNTDPRDGRLEVAVMRTKTVIGLLPALAAAMLDRVADFPDRSPSVDIYSASHVEVSAYPNMPMQSDGDTIQGLTPFAATVLPCAATLLVPKGSYYASQA